MEHDEAAAHRVVGALQDRLAVAAARGDRQRVHVVGQDRARDETDVVGDAEGDARARRQRQRAGAGQGRQDRLDRVDVHGLRIVARQAQEHRAVGRVSAARRAERPEQVNRDVRRRGERRQLRRERQARTHRPHRVRRRGPDPDAEHVEDRQGVRRVVRGNLAGDNGGGRGARRVVSGDGRAEGDGAKIHAHHCAGLSCLARDEAWAGCGRSSGTRPGCRVGSVRVSGWLPGNVAHNSM